MSDLTLVRTLIGDSLQFSVFTQVCNGIDVDFQVPNAPLYPTSLKVYLDGTLQSSGYTADESLGLVTFATAPAANKVLKTTYKFYILTDQQITDVLTQYSEDAPKLAAADCLDMIATSEALIQKKMTLLDISTDGPAVAKALMDRAKSLREQVLGPDGIDNSSFEIIEQVIDDFGWQEKIIKDFQREG